jgi:hypothetical protein
MLEFRRTMERDGCFEKVMDSICETKLFTEYKWLENSPQALIPTPPRFDMKPSRDRTSSAKD